MVDVCSVTFRSMGSPCRIVAGGVDATVVSEARRYVDELERRWSRFLPESEVCQLNRHAGHISSVSDETYLLARLASEAQTLTAGRFNPLMLAQLETLGYRDTWADSGPTEGSLEHCPGVLDPVVLLPEINGVIVPAGATFDPGGIGKGLAIDLVTDFLLGTGATTTSVELGGDLRVTGQPWMGESWRIAVRHPFEADGEVATVAPVDGAVATSSTMKRRWIVGERSVHHLLDSSTGQPAETDVVSVTACSSVAWWAEVAAKVALMAGSANTLGMLERLDAPGLIVTADGVVRHTRTAASRAAA